MGCILLFACEPKKKSSNLPSFDYLVGNWIRTNDTPDNQTYESWTKINDSTYFGHGYTVQQRDTIWQEFATLTKVDSAWYFQVREAIDAPTTDFIITSYTSEAFTCENQENEFPKVIKYHKAKEGLHAEISDDSTIIKFQFINKNAIN